IPNLLINGSSGIAVGMATNIPPHNLNEVIAACLALIDNPNLDIPALMKYIPGPDFPTAGIINGARGIYEGYHTGRGRIYVRARTQIEIDEHRGGKQSIVVTELPSQVNKARLMEKIAELVKDKKVEGITELRDESDKDGMRMVIELRRGEVAEVVLNNLYQHTAMQSVFGITLVALVEGEPRLLNLKQILEQFVRHRSEVVTRRTLFELRKARERAHILEGLAVAIANIDTIITLIKNSPDPAAAKIGLTQTVWTSGAVSEMLSRAGVAAARPIDLPPGVGLIAEGYRLSEVQAQAILDLRLHRLTGLEQEKIISEFNGIIDTVNDLLDILARTERLMQVIRDELILIREQYGDGRRTEIISDQSDLRTEDLITVEDMVVTLSHAGYAKAQPLSLYSAQRRGGKGKQITSVRDEDFVEKLFVASSHDTILCFSSRGKAYWIKVYELPQAGRAALGKPIINLLPLEEGERINAILPVHEFLPNQYIVMATASGTVKKTALTEFARPRSSGLIAVDLRVDDQLVGVAITDGAKDIMLFTSAGKVIRFHEDEVRAMGRTACGVRGIRLAAGQRVISLIIAAPGMVLTATEKGYGKRTPIEEYPVQGRGGQGVISIQTSERNGQVVSAALVGEEDELMLVTNGGTLVRTRVKEISSVGRNTQGVRLISLSEGEKLVAAERIVDTEQTQTLEDDKPDVAETPPGPTIN
ncbi:MAG: DNA gyrase subunit A, partial [Gammaproteobacteria bacterium]